MLGDRRHHLGHLQGQFASRHEHKAVRFARRGRRVDAGQHRDPERQRLARTRAYLGVGDFNMSMLVYPTIFSVVILAIGVVVFNKVQKTFMDTV